MKDSAKLESRATSNLLIAAALGGLALGISLTAFAFRIALWIYPR